MSGKNEVNYRSPLARARHLGSARDGVHGWWMQRVSAVALVVLLMYMVANASQFLSGNYVQVVTWIASPINAVALILLNITMFYHAWLGVREIVEDYVHHKMAKILFLIVLQFICFAFGTAGVFAVMKIAFGG